MTVTYYSGIQRFREFVFLDHDNFAGKKARDWWRQRHPEWEPPPSDGISSATDLALKYASTLTVPKRIRVWVNKQHPEVLGHEF